MGPWFAKYYSPPHCYVLAGFLREGVRWVRWVRWVHRHAAKAAVGRGVASPFAYPAAPCCIAGPRKGVRARAADLPEHNRLFGVDAPLTLPAPSRSVFISFHFIFFCMANFQKRLNIFLLCTAPR